jgi:hypothetical protein
MERQERTGKTQIWIAISVYVLAQSCGRRLGIERDLYTIAVGLPNPFASVQRDRF